MLKSLETKEVVEEYELEDDYYPCSYSKLLGKEGRYIFKCAKDINVYLRPYSSLFVWSTPLAIALIIKNLA